jgi:hypothetical protein
LNIPKPITLTIAIEPPTSNGVLLLDVALLFSSAFLGVDCLANESALSTFKVVFLGQRGVTVWLGIGIEGSSFFILYRPMSIDNQHLINYLLYFDFK